MASPLAHGLFRKAIGESGSFLGPTLRLRSRTQSEEIGKQLAANLAATSISELRARSAADILRAARQRIRVLPDLAIEGDFPPTVDGYILRESVAQTFDHGRQARVPLLAGWNTDEGNYVSVFGTAAASARAFNDRISQIFDNETAEAMKVYPAPSDAQAKRLAQDLAGDQFTAYSTWKWIEVHTRSKKPLFRYLFGQAPPLPAGAPPPDLESPGRGAYHSAEIEFVFGTLASKDLPWRLQDEQVSNLMMKYFTRQKFLGRP
jgi:para-nitrobenzyl esterase